MAGVFNKARGCFTSKKSGMAMKGLTRSHDFKMSAYACKKSRVAGMRRGTKLDVELSDHINKGTELVSKRAKDMMQHLKAAGLYPVEAQLVVANARKRIATAIDMVWKTVENNKPVLVELKCTGMSVSLFMQHASAEDTGLGPLQSVLGGQIPRTQWNVYKEQMRCNAQLYGRTKKLRAGTSIKCMLAISASDAPVLYSEEVIYTPDTGINKTSAGRAKDKARVIEAMSDKIEAEVQKKMRSRKTSLTK